jgi:hypothetical protein
MLPRKWIRAPRPQRLSEETGEKGAKGMYDEKYEEDDASCSETNYSSTGGEHVYVTSKGPGRGLRRMTFLFFRVQGGP